MAQAQHWATKEFCSSVATQVDDHIFEPCGRDHVFELASKISNNLGQFWKVTAPNCTVSHVSGTIHVSRPDVLKLDQQVMDALLNAQAVMTDSDNIHKSRAAIEGRTIQDLLWKGNQTQEPFTTGNTSVDEAIRQRAHTLRWDRDAPDYLRPAGIATVLLSDPCDDYYYGIYPFLGSRIQMLADINAIPYHPLEETNGILSFLASKDGENVGMNMTRVYGTYFMKPEFDMAYANGLLLSQQGEIGIFTVLDALNTEQEFPKAEFGDLLHSVDGYLLDARNRMFMKSMMDHIHDQSTFIAMGSSHLPGTTGIIEMLQAQGFSVKRLPLTGERTE